MQNVYILKVQLDQTLLIQVFTVSSVLVSVTSFLAGHRSTDSSRREMSCQRSILLLPSLAKCLAPSARCLAPKARCVATRARWSRGLASGAWQPPSSSVQTSCTAKIHTSAEACSSVEARPVASGEASSVASGEARPVASGEASPVASGEARPVASGEARPVASGEACGQRLGLTIGGQQEVRGRMAGWDG